MNRVKGRLATATAGLLLAIGGLFAATGSASAASGDSGYVLAFTPIYNCDWDACSYYEITQYNAWLPFDCWQDSPE